MKIRYPLLMIVLGSIVSCATPPSRLSGKTDIPLLLPGERYASWTKDQTSFDEYRYYLISKSNPKGKSITILASADEEKVESSANKKVMIPGIGLVPYRRCSVGGDGEPTRFETDPFSHEDGHGGRAFYIVRVNTDDGDEESMLKSVRWSAPGSYD